MQHSISLSAHPVTRAPESLPPLRSLWAALSCPRGYDIRPARTPKHHGLANSLVRRMYAWRGYRTEAHRQPLEDPNHVTLAAWQYDEVVATLTLRRDSAGGLLADAHYGDVLEGLRRPDRVVCEVSRLAIDPDFSSRELLHGLFRAALDYGREHFSASAASDFSRSATCASVSASMRRPFFCTRRSRKSRSRTTSHCQWSASSQSG